MTCHITDPSCFAEIIIDCLILRDVYMYIHTSYSIAIGPKTYLPLSSPDIQQDKNQYNLVFNTTSLIISKHISLLGDDELTFDILDIGIDGHLQQQHSNFLVPSTRSDM